ncbi:MAG: hypothetical protein AABY32_02805 [Nanoarchaeota archaeon]
MEKVAFHGGVWKKEDLDKDFLKIKDVLYVAPRFGGAYLGMKNPDKSGKEINTLLEIHYSNPNFFRDYRKHSTDLGQEGVWIGTNLRLKKIKDTMVKIPKRLRGSRSLRYKYIVAKVDEENSERTPTEKEYREVGDEFFEKYKKPCYPDKFNKEEKEFFYDSIQRKIKKNDAINNLEIEKEPKTLERVLKISSIIAFFGGIFFLSPILTGNVIGNSSIKTNSITGIVLLTISIFLYIFSTKQKKYALPLPKNNHNPSSH